MDKISIHKQLCDEMHETFIKKDSDYGSSFADLRSEFDNAILIRLKDKYNRLKTLLMADSQQVKDESIDDTLLDLANYAIMELTYRRLESKDVK